MSTTALYIIFGSVLLITMVISAIVWNKIIKPVDIKKDYLKRVLINASIAEINTKINNMSNEEIEVYFEELKKVN